MSARRPRGAARRPAPPPVGSAGRGGGPSRWWWALLAGLWIERVAIATPHALHGALDLVLIACTALVLAIAYRRWARRTLGARAQARRRRERPEQEQRKTR